MKKMPAHLPPLPDGAVYLGECEEIATSSGHRERHNGWFCGITRRWGDFHEWNVGPDSGSGHFAAPADSEIVRLNGCGKPSWESAPEWAEWLAQDADGEWSWFSHKPEKHEILDFWHVHIGQKTDHAQDGPPNPNWQDTLERRPRGCLYASLDEANSEIIRIGQNMRRVLRALDVAVEGRGTKTGDAEESSKRVAEAVSMEQPTFTHVTVRDGGAHLHQSPDLIIPKDVALYADAQSILNTARANDYRIEWDSNGIRGWKEP